MQNHNKVFKKANPFLQGNSDEWMMIEFWNKDLELIFQAVEAFESETNLIVNKDCIFS